MTIISLLILVALGMLLQRILLGWGFENRIEYDCYFTKKEVFEGDELFFIEVIYNRNVIPVPWMRVEINSSKWLEFANSNSTIAQEKRYITSNFAIKSYQKVTRKWHLRCDKRGVYDINIITLISGDLFGGERYSKPVYVKADLVVFPKKVELNDILSPINYYNGVNFVRRWIMEDPFTYAGSRNYIPGDSINKIDWKLTSKTNDVIIKKHDYTSHDDLTIFLNIQSQETEYFGTVDKSLIEVGIKISATIIDNVLENKIPVKLLSNGIIDFKDKKYVITKSAYNSKHIYYLYNILAKIKLKSKVNFDKLLDNEL
ncbi:MAG: DUF58 domain-containing protein, partial [Clostridiales bacterium]